MTKVASGSLQINSIQNSPRVENLPFMLIDFTCVEYSRVEMKHKHNNSTPSVHLGS